MEAQLLEIHKEYLLIHTGMSSRVFAQSHTFDTLHEKGWNAVYSDTIGWTFTPYQFTDVKNFQNNNEYQDEIVITGPAFDGVTLESLFEKTKSDSILKFDQLIETLEKLNSAIEASFLDNDVKLVPNGPLNIIVSKNNNFLFLPDAIFQKAIRALSPSDYAKKYACYLNRSLNNIISEWRFSLACMLYFTFSGSLPYNELKDEKRVEDYFDKHYIPLELILQIPEKKEKALQVINANLSLPAFIQTRSTSKKDSFNKNQKKQHTESQPFFTDTIQSLANSYKKINLTDEQSITLQQDIQRYARSQEKYIRKKRFFRRHIITIAVTLLTIFGLSSITVSIIKGNCSKANTENMSALQVVETFYDGLNKINSDKVESTGTKKAIKKFSDSLSAIFVTQQMRIGYEHIAPYFTPQQWLNTASPADNVIYGISHLKITSVKIPSTEKQNTDLNTNITSYKADNGDTALFTATYYLIRSNAYHEYTILYQEDLLYLEYFKQDFWQITKLDTKKAKELKVNNTQLQADILSAYTQTTPKNRGYEMAKILESSYPWIPDPKTVAAAKNEVLEWIEPEAR
jgi:hypothetical protein